MNIKDSKVLITGGSAGLGKAMAKLLAENGAKVVITGRDEARTKKAAEETGSMALVFDMTDYASIPAKAQEAVDMMGGIDVLINNAGTGTFSVVDEITIDQFEHVFGTNVFGLTLLTQEMVRHFKAQDKGNIINVASTAAQKGFARGSVYAASKFALRALTQCWQAELRPNNIRVMQINPSEVPTAFANPDRVERENQPKKLTSHEIAHAVKAMLEMDDRGMIPELSVWASNPF